jgi:signal transduction histidine kinase
MSSQPDSLMYVYLAGTFFIVLMLAFIFIYIILYQQKVAKFNKQLQEKELEKQHQIYEALLKGEEKERKRIAEELHDGIGAKLSGIKMSIEYLHQEVEVQKQLHTHQLIETLNESIDELRDISHNLQPSVIGIKGLKNALQDHIRMLHKKGQTNISLYWHADELVFENNHSELNIYRMCTELLSNIIKHAKASEASLQIMVLENILQVMAEDNGIGFNNNNTPSGIGLINLQNRVEHEKGQLTIDSKPKLGSTIIIEIPLYKTL